MNTNTLKKFAQNARRKLMDQVEARMEYVLKTDSAELREKAAQVRKLREEINANFGKIRHLFFCKLEEFCNIRNFDQIWQTLLYCN